jgi:hypothetical protein
MSSTIDLLILGAGWTSKFLISLCKENRLQVAATSRTGKEGTILFDFDPESHDTKPFEMLPNARTVLVTFPIKEAGASQRLVRNYQSSRTASERSNLQVRFIQLGATNIWDVSYNYFVCETLVADLSCYLDLDHLPSIGLVTLCSMLSQ